MNTVKIGLVLFFVLCVLQAAQAALPPGSGVISLTVNIPSRSIEVYRDGILLKEYPAAVGKPATPTPLGNFFIMDKEINPCWYPPGQGYAVLSGPANPLGYRWLGFAANYGIHGTNAPWSVGLAVSNGCVRMKEDDVEELFQLVSEGTALNITYERIKIKNNNSGEFDIHTYPDIYGYEPNVTAELRKKLVKAGVGNFFEEKELKDMINAADRGERGICKKQYIKINGRLLTEPGVTYQGETYIKWDAVITAMPVKMQMNQDGCIFWRNRNAKTVLKNAVRYIAISELSYLFGHCRAEGEGEDMLAVHFPLVYVNGKPIDCDVQKDAKGFQLSAFSLAKMTEREISWNPHIGCLQAGVNIISPETAGGIPYLRREAAQKIFAVDFIWHENLQALEVKYPYNPLDATVYVEEGTD